MNRKWIGISVGWFLLQSALWAQQTASSGIVGQVTDATQAAIGGATVTVINTGTRAQRIATTDAAGSFSVPNLAPATYEIRIEKSGFQTAVVSAFELPIGQIAHPSFTLSLGQVSETVIRNNFN